MGTAEHQNRLFMRMASKVRYIPRISLNFEKLVYSVMIGVLGKAGSF